MKKPLITFVVLLVSIICSGQNKFEDGYFIGNDDIKINCLIKNNDWKNNPSEFSYRISEDGEIKTGKIENIKEFGLLNKLKFERHTVDIDKSEGFNLDYLDNNRTPTFEKETLFLKPIAEGEANLYYYEKRNLRRFFYKTQEKTIQQLVYKVYSKESSTVMYNNHYRQQLLLDLSCESINQSTIEGVDYNKNDLKKFFDKYNNCKGNTSSVNYNTNEGEDLFNFTIRPGVTFNSYRFNYNRVDFRLHDLGSTVSYRIGAELEMIMPFNHNKWALLLEVSYQSFKLKNEIEVSNYLDSVTAELNYKSFQFIPGIRYHFLLNEDSKLFVNVNYVAEMNRTSTLTYPSFTEFFQNNGFVSTGVGFKLKNKYSIEFKYDFRTEVIVPNSKRQSDMRTMAFIFGYTLF